MKKYFIYSFLAIFFAFAIYFGIDSGYKEFFYSNVSINWYSIALHLLEGFVLSAGVYTFINYGYKKLYISMILIMALINYLIYNLNSIFPIYFKNLFDSLIFAIIIAISVMYSLLSKNKSKENIQSEETNKTLKNKYIFIFMTIGFTLLSYRLFFIDKDFDSFHLIDFIINIVYSFMFGATLSATYYFATQSEKKKRFIIMSIIFIIIYSLIYLAEKKYEYNTELIDYIYDVSFILTLSLIPAIAVHMVTTNWLAKIKESG